MSTTIPLTLEQLYQKQDILTKQAVQVTIDLMKLFDHSLTLFTEKQKKGRNIIKELEEIDLQIKRYHQTNPIFLPFLPLI